LPEENKDRRDMPVSRVNVTAGCSEQRTKQMSPQCKYLGSLAAAVISMRIAALPEENPCTAIGTGSIRRRNRETAYRPDADGTPLHRRQHKSALQRHYGQAPPEKPKQPRYNPKGAMTRSRTPCTFEMATP
jgi:hypothetical protein